MEHIAQFFIQLVEHVGYAGLFVVMVLGNMMVPVGTEIVVPAAGALVATGHLSSYWMVAGIATLGEVVGATALYLIGYFGGRPVIEKYLARFLHPKELARVDEYFARYGSATVFLCRFVPVVRGVSSLPAGISRMSLPLFVLYTIAGSAIWCAGLSYLGLVAGNHLDAITPYFHQITMGLIALLVVVAAIFVWRHLRPKTA